MLSFNLFGKEYVTRATQPFFDGQGNLSATLFDEDSVLQVEVVDASLPLLHISHLTAQFKCRKNNDASLTLISLVHESSHVECELTIDEAPWVPNSRLNFDKSHGTNELAIVFDSADLLDTFILNIPTTISDVDLNRRGAGSSQFTKILINAANSTVHQDISAWRVSGELYDQFSSEYDSFSKAQIVQAPRIHHDEKANGEQFYVLDIVPQNNVLFLHPDILNTLQGELDSDGAEFDDLRYQNGFLFQYALVNGGIKWERSNRVLSESDEAKRHRILWDKMFEDQSPALLIFRYTDQNSNPIALVPVDESSKFNLFLRQGTQQAVKFLDVEDPWEQTNRALVIANDADENGIPDTFKGKLKVLDPMQLYKRDKSNDSIDDPYWVLNGNVPVSESEFKLVELQGVSPGSRLFLDRQILKSSEDYHAAVSVELSADAIEKKGKPVFYKSEFRLVNPDKWQFQVLTEEREIWKLEDSVDDPYSPVSGALESRISKGKHDASGISAMRLPIIDSDYALSNLTGTHRKNYDGSSVGFNELHQEGHKWLTELDLQFSGANAGNLAPPEIAQYIHNTGFSAKPDEKQPFQRIIHTPPVTVKKVDKTATKATQLQSIVQAGSAIDSYSESSDIALSSTSFSEHETTFQFGGELGEITEGPWAGSHLEQVVAEAKAQLDGLLERFSRLWANPFIQDQDGNQWIDDTARQALVVLRQALVKDRRQQRYKDWLEGKISNIAEIEKLINQWDQFYTDAFELLDSGNVWMDISEGEASTLKLLLTHKSMEEILTLWLDNSSEDGSLPRLFDLVWAKPDTHLFRRALSLVFGDNQTLNDNQKLLLRAQLFDLDELPFDLLNFLNTAIPGMQQIINQGKDVLYDWLESLWNDPESILAPLTAVSDEIKEAVKSELMVLKKEYGDYFTDDIYRDIMEVREDSEQLVALCKLIMEGFPDRLSDLKVVIPQYFFFTERFALKAPTGLKMRDIWFGKFDLCRLGSQIKWDFFLGKEASVIAKLGQDSSLSDILRELDKDYRTLERKNPLGIKFNGKSENIEAFIEKLPQALKEKTWTGLFVINPIADLSQDKLLRDLAGLEFIEVQYAAIGGRRPEDGKGKNLGVYARIFKEEPNFVEDKPDEGSSEWDADLKFGLVKFDVTIADTEVHEGEIVFRMNLTNLFGRKREGELGQDNSFLTKPIFIRGAIGKEEQEDSPDQDKGTPVFEFGAWFDKPYRAEIDVAFVKAVEFKAVKATRNKGKTSLAVTGSLELQNPDFAGVDIEFNGESEDMRIALQGLQIILPSLKSGESFDFGLLRRLDFDFPSVHFALPDPRAYNFFGIELLPKAIGFCRNQLGAHDLASRYLWFSDSPQWVENEVVVPYMEFVVDFGKLPQFGGNRLAGLKFTLSLAIEWNVPQGKIDNILLGMSSLDARNIRIDLFRLIVLEIRRLFVGHAKVGIEEPNGINATAIMAQQIKLKILDWEPLGTGASLDLLKLQNKVDLTSSAPPNQDKAMLGYYYSGDSTSLPGGGNNDEFFNIYWMLIAHNLEFKPEIYNWLLEDEFVAGSSLLDKLLKRTAKRGSDVIEYDDLAPGDEVELSLRADITSEESWLYGISFKLGEILDECGLILQDQVYYGVKLSAEWVEDVFGQPNINLAYIPGPRPDMDKFRTNLHLGFLDFLGPMNAGRFALEWGVDWSYLIDLGFPWNKGSGPDWFRAFSLPMGTYEAKFGVYIQKQTELSVNDKKQLKLAAGVGFYIGYYFATGNNVAWVRAGIGVFAIMEGGIWLSNPVEGLPNPFKSSIEKVEVVGVIGIFAYGEGGVDVWILSARFRVAAVASIESRLLVVKNGPCTLSYSATLYAYYAASVKVGKKPFRWTFRVRGRVGMGVSGQLLLN